MEEIYDEENLTKEDERELSLIDELTKMADEKIDRLGYIDAYAIMDSFHDTLKNGRKTTVIEVREDYIDASSGESLRSYQRLLTLEPEISLEVSGNYTSVIFTFSKDCSDIHILWNILEQFGQDCNMVHNMSEEVPQLYFTFMPMSLGGNYSMAAGCPIFWSLQSAEPFEGKENQVRILFQSDSILFLYNSDVDSQKTAKELQHEIASESMSREQEERTEAEREAFDADRKRFIDDFVEGEANKKHSFQSEKYNKKNQ